MKFLSFFSFLSFVNLSSAQDLLLVIDEQYANKTFDSYSDFTGQFDGDLSWQTVIGENPAMVVDLGDGSGLKNQHYYVNQDGIYTFTRDANRYTTSTGLTLETLSFPDVNNLSTTSNEEIGTAISIFYPWTFRRGYFEIKAKLPAGDGIQSAFHLFGNLAVIPGFNCKDTTLSDQQDYNWQEIDIWETGGSGPNTLRNNIHWSKALETPPPNANFYSCDDFCSNCQYGYRGVNCETEYDFTQEFHTIGLYWDEQYVIFLVDGDIYRYWVKVFDIGTEDCNNHPDPIQTGDPRKILFTDAMTLNLGIGYGVSGPYEADADPGNLNGPNPEEPLPESKLIVEYFRYWVFLPCEDQPDQTMALVNSTNPQFDLHNNNKTIDSYHERLFGHFETGKYITCSNTDIGPSYYQSVEQPQWYSEQLNLIASKQIHLQNGFHAKAAEINFPIESQFHAKIQTCGGIPVGQTMPWINNMTEYPGQTFLENFMLSIGNMIFESYDLSGPLRIAQTDSLNPDNGNAQTQSLIGTTNESIKFIIYPNPVEEGLNFKFSSTILDGKIRLQLVNLQGEVVLEKEVISNEEIIDISHLAGGAYQLLIVTDSETQIFKIVKL